MRRGISVFWAIALCTGLASCGDGAPSGSEAATAIRKQLTDFLPSAAIADLTVTDLKCSKTGDDIYTCEVAVTAVGPAGSNSVVKSYQFTKLNGEWNAKPLL